jgi:hypothetical protein
VRLLEERSEVKNGYFTPAIGHQTAAAASLTYTLYAHPPVLYVQHFTIMFLLQMLYK